FVLGVASAGVALGVMAASLLLLWTGFKPRPRGGFLPVDRVRSPPPWACRVEDTPQEPDASSVLAGPRRKRRPNESNARRCGRSRARARTARDDRRGAPRRARALWDRASPSRAGA